jgi:hypothetical protein
LEYFVGKDVLDIFFLSVLRGPVVEKEKVPTE